MRRTRTVAMGAMVGLVVLLSGGTAGAAVTVRDVPVAGWRVDGVATAILVRGDTTYVGGTFTRAYAPDGTSAARANLAAFSTRTGALLDGFRADTNGTVRALASDGSTLWVGGRFTSIAGQGRSRLAAVDAATGAARTGFSASPDADVFALDLRAGRLFVGGAFTTVSGVARARAAAVEPATGAVDARWNPAADNTVHAVRADSTGSVVYLGGNFEVVGGAPRPGMAAVSGVSGAAVAPAFSNTYRPILGLDLADDGSRLFAAVGGGGNQAAAFDPSTGRRVWRQRADGDVQAVDVHRGTVYFGFHESFEGDTRLRLLAADATNGALVAGFRPTFDRYWGVYALAVSDDTVAAGGDFTRVSGVSAQGFALFSTPTSSTK